MGKHIRTPGLFQNFLYSIFIGTRTHDIGAIAEKMNTPVRRLYEIFEGYADMPAESVRPLFFASGEVKILEYFVKDTGFVLAPLPSTTDKGESLLDECLALGGDVGVLMNKVHDSYGDRRIDQGEAQALHVALDDIQRGVERLRSVLGNREHSQKVVGISRH